MQYILSHDQVKESVMAIHKGINQKTLNSDIQRENSRNYLSPFPCCERSNARLGTRQTLVLFEGNQELSVNVCFYDLQTKDSEESRKGKIVIELIFW